MKSRSCLIGVRGIRQERPHFLDPKIFAVKCRLMQMTLHCSTTHLGCQRLLLFGVCFFFADICFSLFILQSEHPSKSFFILSNIFPSTHQNNLIGHIQTADKGGPQTKCDPYLFFFQSQCEQHKSHLYQSEPGHGHIRSKIRIRIR